MTELIIQSGKHQGRKLVLPDTEILIGRDENCHIRLASSDVSRHHCRLTPTPKGLVALDLSSRNGTFVNEIPIDRETLLQPGDSIRVGNMVFQIPGETSANADEAVAAEKLSDDDIANWLSEEGLSAGEGVKPGDTTIISTSGLDNIEDKPPPPTPREPPKQFKSVAEEAADIIRRHWEMVREKEQNSS